MNFIKLTILFGTIFLLKTEFNFFINSWSSKEQHHIIHKILHSQETLPEAYKLRISFASKNYVHQHIVNDGSYQIDVKVLDNLSHTVTSGNLIFIDSKTKCLVSTNDGKFGGSFSIRRKLLISGYITSEEIRKVARKNIIQIIVKEITKR